MIRWASFCVTPRCVGALETPRAKVVWSIPMERLGPLTKETLTDFVWHTVKSWFFADLLWVHWIFFLKQQKLWEPWVGTNCHDFLDLEHDLPRGSAKHGKTGELGHRVGWEAQWWNFWTFGQRVKHGVVEEDCGHFIGKGRCLICLRIP